MLEEDRLTGSNIDDDDDAVEYVWNEKFSLSGGPEDGVGRRSGRMADRVRMKRQGSSKRTWIFGSVSSGSVGSSEDDSSATVAGTATLRQDSDIGLQRSASKASNNAARSSRLVSALHRSSSRWSRHGTAASRRGKLRKTSSLPRMKRSQTLGTLIAKNRDAIYNRPLFEEAFNDG
mmetsp:Transcript_12422/g.27128  ORF Transcript_12422/g.27128 Transcript_12422/m.27128 type:complete len:176 (-) Transcript_12422:197-724(-)|eukprot:CAMPEP_0185855360 /NCGR_PEP_ID=MMETSP1354-20130828/25438_1 /TAXON_ID=708628 /ORGANISM="Erythrolobus madagascarensis, Strain CCMP3276" /LENGTH=175 /DNA_ID=CAMNT_0028557371 /DNA_START=142 /DNA_END=669 /DNA_ORIENTATION=+